MDRHHKRHSSPFGSRESNTPNPPECVCMDDGHVRFLTQRTNQIKGHEITADGYQLSFALCGDSPDRNEGLKPFDLITGFVQWIRLRFVLECRAIHDSCDILRAQAVEQSLNCR